MPKNIRVAAYLPRGKEIPAMKLSQNSAVWCLLIVCLTLLLLTLIIHPRLCEIRVTMGSREIAAIMACGVEPS
ncbi:Hok/Gef-like protein [Shimwellia blattae DSM 4481 = NBRC 105725]|uniref:Hok/Gef-like protein n=1 Tax=Shimwellia blattae (strain ATCC 29907 / DSM 4481 / JCM 1650 / NBRC 105725 / CDC 9005-74) TaxID=630626 RepID=I2B5H8_SHIBC|nr:Hok/Gef-like protein [Shimwellia blattae DSM 4481 = NBRC 105725]GAB82912.1 hypothetical protein EB105725_37_00140 [Shimwellia blattae DSM 4481 = NBRC 105725]